MPLLYAHRGARLELPENTLPAFQRALELGASALETDAHLTRDGHVILAHDATAARMAGVPLAWAHATLAEARSCDVGWGFRDEQGGRPYAGRGLRVPTLEELLALLPGVPLSVDLKQHGTAMVAPVLALLRRLRAEEHVTLASFSSLTLLAARRRGYAGATGLGREEAALALACPAALWRRLPWRGQVAQLPTRLAALPLTSPRVVAHLRGLGLRVVYWTVNDPTEARALLALGVDGLVSDDPALLAPLFTGAL